MAIDGFNANLFHLTKHEPLKVKTYIPSISPQPPNDANFYQVLGRVANTLTKQFKIPVISDFGKIKVLESEIGEESLDHIIELEEIGEFQVTLKQIADEEISIDSVEEYKKLVNQIVDVALTKLSGDFFKYVEKSPFVIKRGEGFFDEQLRNDTGIEDGTQYYRGVRIVQGQPYFIVNRSIELRSLGNLLKEMKTLGVRWARAKKQEDTFDFYDPPKQFIQYINWMFRGKMANTTKYPARGIMINEITWEVRAEDKVAGELSLIDIQRKKRGITIKDPKQPLVKWAYFSDGGVKQIQYQIPELLVVGHTFQDLSRRISKSKISQVFDIMHPNCSDQQRKIYDFVIKLDAILKDQFASIYPSKIAIDKDPTNINEHVTVIDDIKLKLDKKTITIAPPYGINFYKKYAATMKFEQPITKDLKTLAVTNDSEVEGFISKVSEEWKKRNGGKLLIEIKEELDAEADAQEYDVIFTISDDADFIKNCKEIIINKYGKCHQNINKQSIKPHAIAQIVMNVTLKLGGYPWVLVNGLNYHVLSILSYRNPFDSSRFYIYNIMNSDGTLTYQSSPFDEREVLGFLGDIRGKISSYKKLLVLITFNHEKIEDYIKNELSNMVDEYLMLLVIKKDNLRTFKTFKTVSEGKRRRRAERTSYPLEAHEESPQGLTFKASDREYYLVTTASMNIGTYSRGCPMPIKIEIMSNKGIFDIGEVMKYLMSLSTVAGTSGHVTRQPAPIYYLNRLATYLNQYGEPTSDLTRKLLFYV